MYADWKPLPEAKLRYDNLEEYARVQMALVQAEELEQEREDVTVVLEQNERRRVSASFVLDLNQTAKQGGLVRIYFFKQTAVGGKVVDACDWWVSATILSCKKPICLMEAASSRAQLERELCSYACQQSPRLEAAEEQKLFAAHHAREEQFIEGCDELLHVQWRCSSSVKRFCFPYVLIDEWTRATKRETLVALVHGTQQVTLVGDERQDEPSVQSGKAMREGLDVSLFVRCLLLKQPAVRLSVQYRMHPEIASFVLKQFYNGELQSGVSA
ncbi:hypothetical protein Esti_005807 [Eimeria stiedai]